MHVKGMKKQILILFTFLLCCSTAYSQPYTLWMKKYGNNLFQRFESLTGTSDGGIIAIGTAQVGEFFNYSDIWIVKTNAWGDTLWTKEIGDIWGSFDAGSAIQETSDMGLIVLGRIGFPWNDSDAWLIKLDSLGNHEWDRTYMGDNGVQAGRALAQTDDGGFVFSSFFSDTAATVLDNDVLVVRTNSEGDIIWTKTFGGEKNDKIGYISNTNDGGFLLTGRSNSFNEDTLNYPDLWLIRLDGNGTVLWEKDFDFQDSDLGYSSLELPDGKFIISGATGAASIGINHDAWILKVDTDGDTLWTRTYGGINREQAQSIIRTADNSLVFGGFTNSPPLSINNADVWLVKLDSIGDTIWTKTAGYSLSDLAYEVIAFNSGYILAGYSRVDNISNDETHTEGLLIRMGPALSRLAAKKVTARVGDLIELPVIFNYPLELSFNSINVSISGYQSDISFVGINDFGTVLEKAGWEFEYEENDSGFSARFWGDSSLTAEDTLFIAEFFADEYKEEFITIRIDSANIGSGSVPLELYGGGVQLLPIISVDAESSTPPEKYYLQQNYPNPFNPVTKIEFSIFEAGKTTLIIYNLLGQEVARLVDDDLSPGRYSYDWNASELSTGIYIYKLSSNEFTESRKMVLLK